MATAHAAQAATEAVGTTTRARVGAWMMILSPLGFVAVVLSMAGVVAAAIGASTFTEITRAQMDELGTAWVWSRVVVAAATAVVVLGAGLVAGDLCRSTAPPARAAAWGAVGLTVVNLAAGIADIVLGAVQTGFTTATLGADLAWQVSRMLLPWTFGAVLLELLLLCAALWWSGRRRATGLVMGTITVVSLVMTVFAVEYLPPFLVALIACPIGISWIAGLRRRARLS